MKHKIVFIFITIFLLLGITGCANKSKTVSDWPASTGQIYLYGEQHGSEPILEKELELWHNFYHNEGMRHLFVEYPYYTAQLLNIWMEADNDDILNTVYDDWAGTSAQVPQVKEFCKKIKSEYPETIFHGTDVGHQYATTGERYLEYLEEHGMKDSKHTSLTLETIEQGKLFYDKSDDVYRENKMAENFIREFDALTGENVMGIYGNAHTGLDAKDFTGAVSCMASQLKERYGDAVHSEDLTWITKDIEPIRTDSITINETEFVGAYFGKQDISFFEGYVCREFWRLEDAYEVFKDMPTIGDVLPYDNYPMLIETGQVFVIDYTKTDGSITRMYYRSDGNEWDGSLTTEGFNIE